MEPAKSTESVKRTDALIAALRKLEAGVALTLRIGVLVAELELQQAAGLELSLQDAKAVSEVAEDCLAYTRTSPDPLQLLGVTTDPRSPFGVDWEMFTTRS